MKNKKKISDSQRRLASIDLTSHYLNTISPDWRLIKVKGIEKQLREKYSFYKDLVAGASEDIIEARIAQEVTIGLYFDAISECIQYVEDLFALIQASRTPDYFIRNIVTYKAGQITNAIKVFKPCREAIDNSFHLPRDIKFPNEENTVRYGEGIEHLNSLVTDIRAFYLEYEYFHLQYKHGLTIPLRPFGNFYSREQVAEEKAGTLSPILAAYDNFNLPAAAQKGTFTAEKGVFMPGFTPNVSKILVELQEENNYLRFVLANPYLTISHIVDMASKIMACIGVFVFNYFHRITDNPSEIAGRLPLEYSACRVLNFTYHA